MYVFLLFFQLALIVIELILIGFVVANKKKVKLLIIIVLILQVLLSGWLCIDRYEHKKNQKPCSCMEAYECDKKSLDKNGYIKCKCLDLENNKHEVLCPADANVRGEA